MITNELLTQDQRELRQMVRDFAEKELIPISAEYDRKGEFPREAFRKAVEMGLTTITVPERFGGLGLGHFEETLVAEELAYGDAGFAVAVGACTLGTMPIMLGGNEEQKQRAAEILCGGGLAAFCLTEAAAGSDAAALRTTAQKEGDEYVLNGAKCFITNDGVADLYVVFASLDLKLGAKGICAFMVERSRAGVSAGKDEDKVGIRLSNTCEVLFENVRVPAANLIGREGQGFLLAMQTLNHTRAEGSSAAVGICQRAIDLSVRYSKERVTFGKPICVNQGIQFMLADMEMTTQAARGLVWNAAKMQDTGVVDAGYGAVAKAFGGDAAMKVTTDAVQIFGGYGYSREYPVEKLMRDAKIFQIFEGTNQIQRMVIAGAMLK